jgi:mono/diheme cytochrome c family protein
MEWHGILKGLRGKVLAPLLMFAGAAGWPVSLQAEVYSLTRTGQHLAEAHCIACHALGTSNDVHRRDRTSTLRELAPGIIGDPEWARLFLTNPHREMVGVSLNRAEIEALFAYIRTLQSPP